MNPEPHTLNPYTKPQNGLQHKPALVFLDLGHNMISGPLELLSLPAIRVLCLAGNALTSPLDLRYLVCFSITLAPIVE